MAAFHSPLEVEMLFVSDVEDGAERRPAAPRRLRRLVALGGALLSAAALAVVAAGGRGRWAHAAGLRPGEGGADVDASVGLDEREPSAEEPLKILFVGNSFTYGPADYRSPEKQNNLPRMFKLVAESLGHPVDWQEDSIGGCSAYAHRPSANPAGRNCRDAKAMCSATHSNWVKLSDGCTVNKGITWWPDSSPCPQALQRKDFGAWDVVVLQDHSLLPSIPDAVKNYFLPASREYSRVLKQSGRKETYRFGEPLLASYMTWGYYDGVYSQCPGPSGNPACFPFGELSAFVPNCTENRSWFDTVETHACQSYSLARGYSESLTNGARVVVPAGLAWEAARGSEPLPEVCRATIDSAYGGPGRLAGLELPLRVQNQSYARFKGSEAHRLYRDKGPTYTSPFCDDACHHDHHASAQGMYLNALVFYATLFKSSPIGAAFPQGQTVDGMVLPTIDAADAEALQHIAHDVVLPHLDVWWSGSSYVGDEQSPDDSGSRGIATPSGFRVSKPALSDDI